MADSQIFARLNEYMQQTFTIEEGSLCAHS